MPHAPDPLAWLDRLAALGAWSLEGFWLPVALWTLAAALALLADARLRVRRPLVRRDLLTALLAALPVTLALRALLSHRGPAPLAVEIPFGAEVMAVAGPAGPAVAAAPLPAGLLVAGGLVVLAGIVAAVGLARLAGQAARLARWRRVLPEAPDAAVQARADALAGSLGLPSVPVRVGGSVPLTFGVRAPVIVVPAELVADEAALDLALLHELAHVRHGDARGHLLACGVGAAFGWHPLVRLAARRLELAREQACDAAVVERLPGARRAYADLLVRFAAGGPARLALSASGTPLAPTMAVRPSHLRTRLEAMQRHLVSVRPALAPGLAALALGAAVLALPVFAGAPEAEVPPPSSVAEVPADFAPAAPTAAPSRAVAPARADTTPPVPVTVVDPVTPEIARRAGIRGRVFVRVRVDEDGRVADARVVRSENDLFDEPALVAVRQWRFTPATSGGRPVPTEVVVPFQFMSDGTAGRVPDPAPPPAPDPGAPTSAAAPSPPEFVPVDRQPVPKTQAQAVFPAAAQRNRVEGRVIAKIVVRTDGTVGEARAERISLTDSTGANLPAGNPYEAAFGEAALTSVRAWTFEPAMREGTPVAVWVAIPIRFRTRDASGREPAAPASTLGFARRLLEMTQDEAAASFLAQNLTRGVITRAMIEADPALRRFLDHPDVRRALGGN